MLNIYIDEDGRVFEGKMAETMIDLEKGLENMKQIRRQLELEETLKGGKSRLRLFKDGFKDGLKDEMNHKITMRSSIISAAIGGVMVYVMTKDIKTSSKAVLEVAAKTYALGVIQCSTIDGVVKAIEGY